MVTILTLVGSLILVNSCKVANNKNDYLRKVLGNLEQIKSATYFSTISGSAPGDTAKFVTYDWYKKEYNNPADVFIGSSFAWFQPSDTTKLYYFYDGLAQAYIDTDLKSFVISSAESKNL